MGSAACRKKTGSVSQSWIALPIRLGLTSGQAHDGQMADKLLDQAGWHTTERLDIPANITILPLPSKCLELNPAENVWQFMRDN